jgi:branched-subunit amino acid ABC-type transport system permease component
LVGEFFSFALLSVPYGCAFALVAVGLVLTYRATGVFNFAFAAEAYAAAVVYAEFCANGVNRGVAAGIVVLILAPAFGALLDFAFFSRVPPGNLTAKVVMALGLMVILPQVVLLLVGQNTVLAPPTPFLSQGIIWTIGTVPIVGQQVCQVAATFAVLAILALMLRTRRFGLPVRAAVESPKLLELSGVDSRWVLRAAWMLSTALAALAGVLYAPIESTVQFNDYSLVLVAAIAAAAVGGLRNLPLAVLGGILLGIVWGVVQGYVPNNTIWYTALVPSLPFFMLLLLLIFNPTFRHLEDTTDPMAAVEPPPPAPALALRPPVIDRAIRRWRWPLLVVAVAAVVVLVPKQWVLSLTYGVALSIIFLSITLLTGLAGQLSLAQAMFAGIGAFTTGQLSVNFGVPILIAALAGALVAGVGGWAASLPALRLRGLPVALLTLCLALLGDSLLFNTSWIIGSTSGMNVARPSSFFGVNFSSFDSEGFFVLSVVVMVAVAGVVHLLLRGTTGRALTAVHASPIGAASAGVPVRRLTILVFILSASIAGLGGAFYAMTFQNISNTDFSYFYGPTFLVIVVTVGATTVEGAITAGMAFALLNQAFTYLPTKIGSTTFGSLGLTIVLLSFGAFTYASHPEGIFEFVKRKVATSVFRAVEHREAVLASAKGPG